MDRLKHLWQRWQASRAGRALERYTQRGGNVLCGGMAYTTLFSLFAALTIGFTAFSTMLGGQEALGSEAIDQVETWVPGLIDTGSGGLIKPDQLVLSGTSWTYVGAIVVLLWTATTFVGALRVAVRSMFDLPDEGPNFLVKRLLQLAGYVLLLAGVLVGAAVGVVVSTAAPLVLDQIGLGGASRVVVRVLGLLAGVVVDAAVVAGVVRYVAGVRIPWRELVTVAVTVGVATGALRWAGSSIIVETAGRNALLAGFATLVSVLLLVNIVARVLLLACAWAAERNGDRPDAAPDLQVGTPEVVR